MIIINGLEMPKENEQLDIVIHPDGKVCYCLDLECKQIATAEPIKHGTWKPFDLTWGRSIYACTSCGEAFEVPTEGDKPMYDYCPYCGARMMDERREDG